MKNKPYLKFYVAIFLLLVLSIVGFADDAKSYFLNNIEKELPGGYEEYDDFTFKEKSFFLTRLVIRDLLVEHDQSTGKPDKKELNASELIEEKTKEKDAVSKEIATLNELNELLKDEWNFSSMSFKDYIEYTESLNSFTHINKDEIQDRLNTRYMEHYEKEFVLDVSSSIAIKQIDSIYVDLTRVELTTDPNLKNQFLDIQKKVIQSKLSTISSLAVSQNEYDSFISIANYFARNGVATDIDSEILKLVFAVDQDLANKLETSFKERTELIQKRDSAKDGDSKIDEKKLSEQITTTFELTRSIGNVIETIIVQRETLEQFSSYDFD